MVDHARRRTQHLNGDAFVADRIMLADSHGDRWAFRAVTYKTYPALGDGPFSFFCLQPDCGEWGVLKPTDFQADAELARLIPALQFMQGEFHQRPDAGGHRQDGAAEPVPLPPPLHRAARPDAQAVPARLPDPPGQGRAARAARRNWSQIAKDCGFAHQSHFTSRFKQATGLTPTRWRKMALARKAISDN